MAADGLDVELDQYHQNEIVDWPRWCKEQLRPENSDFVLMICSAEYKNRIEGRSPADKGRGVFWEGSIIDGYLYGAKANDRFIPILLDDESEESLPQIVRSSDTVQTPRFWYRGWRGRLHKPIPATDYAT